MQGCWDYPFADGAAQPGSPVTRAGALLLTGWALNGDRPPRVRILVDGKAVEETIPDFRREDIDIIFHTQKAPATPSGWVCVLDTARFGPGVHEIEVKLGGGLLPSRSLGRRSIDLTPRDHSAADAFLARALTGDGHVRDGHQHYFGATPGAWRSNPSSAIGLSGHAQAIFASGAATLVVGAGVNNTIDGVYQLDIFDYPNIDVATAGGRFPFADASFDGVVCENVIEHVPDPPLLVGEIARVLKPGGQVGLNGTNLHFTHGFPSHYFNPTEFGMKLLLEEQAGFEGVYDSLDAVASLRTVLTYFDNALSPAARKALARHRFGDIMAALRGDGPQSVLAAIRTIAPAAEKAISTNIYFRGAKRR